MHFGGHDGEENDDGGEGEAEGERVGGREDDKWLCPEEERVAGLVGATGDGVGAGEGDSGDEDGD